MASFNKDSDYQRPRRPDQQTIAYLKSLPLDVTAAHEEIDRYLNGTNKEENGEDGNSDEDDFPQLFRAALSAIEEIGSEIASLAGDEDGSEVLEVLTRITAPYSETAIRQLLSGCSGYYLHLATHRYGSHVLQTILRHSTTYSHPKDLAQAVVEEDAQDNNMDLPSLSDLILQAAEELTPFSSQLAIHICGSHVLRTLLCVLSGVDLHATPPGTPANRARGGGMADSRRGKPKKKKKKKSSTPSSTDDSLAISLLYMTYHDPSRMRIQASESAAFQTALKEISTTLTDFGDEKATSDGLSSLASHSSAGPLLIVLLKVLTYASCPNKKRWYSQKPEKLQRQGLDHRQLGIHIPEPTFEIDSPAHHVAQKLLRLFTDSSSSPSDSAKSATYDIIYNLAGEVRGSRILEAFLHLSPDSFYKSILNHGHFMDRETLQDYAEHTVGNFVLQTVLSTIRDKAQAEAMLKVILPLISNGLAVDAAKRRRSILWRATELAAKYRVGQDGLLKAVRLGFVTTFAKQIEDDNNKGDDTTKGNNDDPSSKKKKRKKASAAQLSDCVRHLLAPKVQDDGSRIQIDVAGGRSVYHVLHFAPRLCEEVLKGLTELSHETLEMFAKDSLASRCVWDGILQQQPTDEHSYFSKAILDLFTKLQGRWVALGCDRVGHHVCKKMFDALPNKQQQIEFVEELSPGVSRLSGNSMGRSILEACAVKEFSQGKDEWQNAINKRLKKDRWLNEILAESEVFDDAEAIGEKRKGHSEGKNVKKRRTKGFSNVDAVMKAITIPAHAVKNKN